MEAINNSANQFDLLCKKAQNHSAKSEYNESLECALQAFSLAEQSRNYQQMFFSQNMIGVAHRNLGSFSIALEAFRRALHYAEVEDNHKNKAVVLGNIGVVYRNLTDYGKALDYYKRAMTECELTDDDVVLMTMLGNIGNIYGNLEDHKRALDFYYQSLSIAEKNNDLLSIARLTANIGNIFAKTNEHDKALQNYNKALSYYEKTENKNGIMIITGNIGSVLLSLKEYDKALKQYYAALAMSRELNDKHGCAEWLGQIGELLAKQEYDKNNFAAAEEMLLESLALSDEIGIRLNNLYVYRNLATLYKNQERWRKYAEYLERFHELDTEIQGLKIKEQADKFIHERELSAIRRDRELLMRKNVELEEANTFKSKLLGVAAHDLKNPLGNIIGAIQVMLSNALSDDPNREWLSIALESSKRMRDLITELLESSSASVGAIEIKLEYVELSEIIQAVCAISKPLAERKKQYFLITISDELWIAGDAARLFQVFENIISNSIKYSPFGKSIEISTAKLNDKAIIEIRDHGQGLTKEDMPKLFGQFQRLSAKPTGGESSNGLGLHIARHIVSLHNGKIWAESEGAGKGAVFVVELPLKESNDLH